MEVNDWDDEPAFYVSELSMNTVKFTTQINGKLRFSKTKTDECTIPVYWDKIVLSNPSTPIDLVKLREHWQVAKVLDMTDAEIDFADYVLITRDVEALHGIVDDK